MNNKAQQALTEYTNNNNEKLNNLLTDLADVHDLIGTELIHLDKQSGIATQTIAETRELLKKLQE